MSVAIDLTGKVALVTGASRGIGREIAARLTAAGAKVAGVARGAVEGPVAMALKCDVASYDEVEKTVEAVLKELSRIDILVNNAGVTDDQLLLRMSAESWKKVIDVNLTGTFNFCKALARPMMKQREGRIVNVSSVIGIRGNAGQANYAASKAGIIGFTKSIARELASRGVTANVVAPGFVETDMTAKLTEEQRQSALSAVPLGAIGAPRDVADAVLFLASPLARYITGAVLTVDGGMAM